jgi:hypothetical protein
MIHFSCPKCHKGVHAKDKAGGRKAKCPSCGEVILIPFPNAIDISPANPNEVSPTPSVTVVQTVASQSALNEGSDIPDARKDGAFERGDLQTSPIGHKSHHRGPSLVSIAVGGLILVGILVSVTLWATGKLSNRPRMIYTGNSPERSSKVPLRDN